MRGNPDKAVVETARKALEKAEAGDASADQKLDQARRQSPPSAEAAEQVASDGPGKRGLDR